MKNKPSWASSHQKRAWREILRIAQLDICAGCGQPFGRKPRGVYSPYFPTLDHVLPRSCGGHHSLNNLLLKHRKCNEERKDTPATGCDILWQAVVDVRLPWARRVLELIAEKGP